VSLREGSRQLEMALSTLQHHIKSGHVTLINGKVDVEVARIQLEKNTDPVQQRRALAHADRSSVGAAAPASENSDNWFERRNRADALRAELELNVRAGQLIEAAEIDRRLGEFLATLATKLDVIPDAIAAEFGVDDEHRRKLRYRAQELINRAREETVVAAGTETELDAA
jgi:predicted kinase